MQRTMPFVAVLLALLGSVRAQAGPEPKSEASALAEARGVASKARLDLDRLAALLSKCEAAIAKAERDAAAADRAYKADPFDIDALFARDDAREAANAARHKAAGIERRMRPVRRRLNNAEAEAASILAAIRDREAKARAAREAELAAAKLARERKARQLARERERRAREWEAKVAAERLEIYSKMKRGTPLGDTPTDFKVMPHVRIKLRTTRRTSEGLMELFELRIPGYSGYGILRFDDGHLVLQEWHQQ